MKWPQNDDNMGWPISSLLTHCLRWALCSSIKAANERKYELSRFNYCQSFRCLFSESSPHVQIFFMNIQNRVDWCFWTIRRFHRPIIILFSSSVTSASSATKVLLSPRWCRKGCLMRGILSSPLFCQNCVFSHLNIPKKNVPQHNHKTQNNSYGIH